MSFKELAKYLEKLEGVSSRNEMTVILAELLGKASPEDARLIVYLSAGRLGPAYNSPDMGVADKMMLKALGEGAEEIFRETGDLGRTAEKLKTQNSKVKSESQNLKISEVHQRLMKIAELGGGGSQEGKQKLIAQLVADLDPVGAKYAVKIVLGKLRTGFSDMTVLDSLSWMLVGDKSKRGEIEKVYNVRADMGEIAETLKRLRRIERLEPGLGTPILMARAERAKNPREIWERNGRCALEYKLDGLRIQAHLEGGIVMLFSRGLENVTAMYPDIVQGLQKQIKKDCIVEGEMIAVGENGRFLPFQETVQRKRKYNIEAMSKKVPLKIYLFDALLVGGTNVMLEENEKRRGILENITSFNPPLTLRGGNPKGEGDTVKLIPRKIANSILEIEKYFDKAIADGTEGIIAKKLDGPYQAGARDFNWIKYKKSYAQSTMADTIDAVVMGYDVGQGKRAKFGIGDFLIGIYQPEGDKYLTVAKIGTGLTDEEWRRMRQALSAQSSVLSEKPENYEVSKQMNCDYWAKPKVVVEILADEITKSPMHTSGFALRFPRLVDFREKKPEDSTSFKELLKMFKLQQEGR